MANKIVLFEENGERVFDPRWGFILRDNKTESLDMLKNFVHYHSFFEVEIIYSGRTKHILNNKVYEAVRGDVYLLRYFDFHTYCNYKNEDTGIYNLAFKSTALPDELINLLINTQGNLFCHFEDNEFESLLKDMQLLIKEKNKHGGNEIIHINMMKTVFSKIILTILNKCFERYPSTPTNSILPFQQALSLIQCHFRESITLNEIAHRIGLTPNYLGKLFTENFNMSFSAYLRRLRLEYAKSLLKFYNYSIEQIASLSGFGTSSHFVYCFKSAYNITPKQYMLKQKNENLSNRL